MPTFEMTGFVKIHSRDREMRYKQDFVEYVKQFGWHHERLHSFTDYLIYSRKGTQKYKNAQRMGVKTITYDEALEIMEGKAIWKII